MDKNDPLNSIKGRISRRDFLKIAATSTTACLLLGCSEKQTDEYSEISYCGIACKEACPGRKYPQNCDTCKTSTGKHSPFWESCTIRECAQAKKVITCAHCDEYEGCDDPLWEKYPMLRNNVNRIRDQLQG